MTKKKKPAEVQVEITKVGSKANKFESGLLMGPGRNKEWLIDDPEAATPNALEYEDDFKGIYNADGKFGKGVTIIQPPFNPLVLEKLVQHNNTLEPCIEAMVTNIDGTGIELVLDEESEKNKDDEKAYKTVKGFFKECWPGTSFVTERKKLRRDLETLGYGFLEVIRNPLTKKMVGCRHVEGKTMRLLNLGRGHSVKRTMSREGEKVEVNVTLRFRRFVQKIGTEYIFFKEFKADPDLDKETGEWIEEGKNLPLNKRASEIIYFTVNKDINTPYGIPRWIGQLPSVLGSRKAEDYNLEFFDNGGVPPFILTVSGGIIATEARDALEKGLASTGPQKQRGLVIEAHSSSGSLDDKGNNVQMDVIKFGAEKQSDSMFENYDERCERRIRKGFRIPPIFIGVNESYNFSSAVASYLVGEAQVFGPERQEFDEIINLNIVRELQKEFETTYKIRSLPLTVNDAKEKIMGLKIAADKQCITKGELLSTINEITGLNMDIAEGIEDELPQLNQRGNDPASDSAVFESNTSDHSGEKNKQLP